MRLFSCSKCEQLIFFENVRCARCGAMLAYLPGPATMSAMIPDGDVIVACAPIANGERFRLCRNSLDHGVCNWAVPVDDDDSYCRGCRLNDVIPNLSDPDALVAWGRLEHAKKRLLYTLFDLGLPVPSGRDPNGGLVFSFKESLPGGAAPVLTGHDSGHITLNIAEADNPGRERLREQLGETYRTVLGHFRHEIGHYYWDVLVRDSAGDLPKFRDLFGDPTKDYGAELDRHYKRGPPADWPKAFVSSYATMHPWEDWAETWAHYLHMVDTLGTARAYGLILRPNAIGASPRSRAVPELGVAARRVDFDDFDDLFAAWIPLTLALNSLNRGMGMPDAYPFVLSDRAIVKLRFVHDVIERASRRETSSRSEPR